MKIQRKGIRGRVMALTVVALSVAGLAVTPLGSAFASDISGDSDGDGPDKGGPVIYLSRHGAPTLCSFGVTTLDKDNRVLEKTGLDRVSCDGTLWLEPGAKTIQITGATSAGDFTNTTDKTITDVNDFSAYCLLAKAAGSVVFTNSSLKGGDCNGK